MRFPTDFIWGAASSAYQIEGHSTEKGGGVCIWDTFSHTPGNIYNDDNGDIACDAYHRYEEDISLMKELGVKGNLFTRANTIRDNEDLVLVADKDAYYYVSLDKEKPAFWKLSLTKGEVMDVYEVGELLEFSANNPKIENIASNMALMYQNFQKATVIRF